jgi:hypothetical protein
MEVEKPLPDYIVKLDNYSSKPVFHILDTTGKAYETLINNRLSTPSPRSYEYYIRRPTPSSVTDKAEVLVPREDLKTVLAHLNAGEDIGFENTIGSDLLVYVVSCLHFVGKVPVPGKMFPVVINLDSEYAPILKISAPVRGVKLIIPVEGNFSPTEARMDVFDLTGRLVFLNLVDTQPWPVHTVTGTRCRSKSIPFQMVGHLERRRAAAREAEEQALKLVPVLPGASVLPSPEKEGRITASEALSEKSVRESLRLALKITYERIGDEEWAALTTKERRQRRKSQSVPKWAIHAVKVDPGNLIKICQGRRGKPPPPPMGGHKPYPNDSRERVARSNRPRGREKESPRGVTIGSQRGKGVNVRSVRAVRRVLRDLSRRLHLLRGGDVSHRLQAVSTAWGRLAMLMHC